MSPVWVLLLFHFWVVNPSRCFLCLYTSLFYFLLSVVSFSLSVFFISLCVTSVALALVFMPGLYSTAYRATFPALFNAVASSLFLLPVCFLFVFSILSRQCPLLAPFLSVLFCLLSLLISDFRFDLVWSRLSCDHGWIRSGPVDVR